MKDNSQNKIGLIIGYFRSKQSDDKLYDNREEDLSNSVLFASYDKNLLQNEFRRIVKREKECSWLADYSVFCLPKTITLEEDENEFYCYNKITNELTHIQIVYSLITNSE